MMEKQVTAPETVWGKLLVGWVCFFAVMGVLNLYVAYNYDTDSWVNFKLFGGIGLMILFVIGQAIVLAPHMKERENE